MATSTANTWADVVHYANTHPHRDGGSWSGWCQSFVWRSGGFANDNSFPTARDDCIDARARGHLITQSKLKSAGLTKFDVPAGWLALWDYGSDGHVFWVAGNGRYLGASAAVTSSLGQSMGYVSMDTYDGFSHGPPTGYSPYQGYQHLSGEALKLSDGTTDPNPTPTPTPTPPGGTTVLTSDDKAWIKSTIDTSVTTHIDDIVNGIWAHSMNSAVDGASHLVQTYMAWAQRDAAAVRSKVDNASPARILAKETSTPDIWALNPQQGTKRHVTPGQWTVLSACGIKYEAVADGSLAAFTTVT